MHYGTDETADEGHYLTRSAIIKGQTCYLVKSRSTEKSDDGIPVAGRLDLQPRVPGLELAIIC